MLHGLHRIALSPSVEAVEADDARERAEREREDEEQMAAALAAESGGEDSEPLPPLSPSPGYGNSPALPPFADDPFVPPLQFTHSGQQKTQREAQLHPHGYQQLPQLYPAPPPSFHVAGAHLQPQWAQAQAKMEALSSFGESPIPTAVAVQAPLPFHRYDAFGQAPPLPSPHAEAVFHSHSQLSSVQALIGHMQQLEAEREAVVAEWQRLVSQTKLSASDFGLLQHHFNQQYQRLNGELNATQMTLDGSVRLVTAAELPSLPRQPEENSQQQFRSHHAQPAARLVQQAMDDAAARREREATGERAGEESPLPSCGWGFRRDLENERQASLAPALMDEEEEEEEKQPKPKKSGGRKSRKEAGAPPNACSAYIVRPTTQWENAACGSSCDSPASSSLPSCALQFFHVERMRRWTAQHPNAHVSAAVQGRVSGEEWRRLTDEEKLPFVLMAEEDKRRHQQLKRNYEASKKQQTPPATKGQGKGAGDQPGEAEEVASARRKGDLAMGGDAGELSPAMSRRSIPGADAEERAETEDVKAEAVQRVSPGGRLHLRAQVVEQRPQPLRPPTARRLWQEHQLSELREQAARERTKFRKGEASKVRCRRRTTPPKSGRPQLLSPLSPSTAVTTSAGLCSAVGCPIRRREGGQ